jgi:hypothetical protein
LIEEASILGIDKFLYKYLKTYGEKASFAAKQAELRTYAQLRLPSFYKNECLYTARSLEQCTSERVALFKASLFRGNRILILAGGLGVDDWAFSLSFRELISLDPDEDLNRISRFNYEKLGAGNIKRLDTNAEVFLTENEGNFDLIYADPDRRNSNTRQILLSQHQPDIISLMPMLRKISQKILIKCSPMYDHEMAARELSYISDIHILSQQGEVKEMLVLLDTGKNTSNDFKIICTELGKTTEHSAEFMNSDNSIPPVSANIAGYFYECASGIVKVRKHHHYASVLGLSLIDRAVPFYCSETIVNPYQGRCLSIIQTMRFQEKACRKYLADNNISKANLKARGLKFSTAEAAVKLGIRDGGEDYLFLFPFRGQTVMAHCHY